MKRPPLIVEQTSSKHMGNRDISDLPMILKRGQYVRDRLKPKELIDEERDDFDIVANMYNGLYGKHSVNMLDVVRGITEARVVSLAKK